MATSIDNELDIIKQAEQIIIKNLNTLDEELRSNLFSRFQRIRYKKLDFYEAYVSGLPTGISAFYSQADQSIYIIDDETSNNLQLSVLVHEMIHAITDNSDDYKYRIGLAVDEIKELNKQQGLKAYFHEYVGINEGFTEFFAKKFLNNSHTKSYPFSVHIIDLLSDTCGYENLKKLYFNNNLGGLKELIKNKYHLDDYLLVDKLINQMDAMTNCITNFRYANDYIPYVKICYETMLQIEIHKRSFEQNKKVVLTDEQIDEYFNSFSNYYYTKYERMVIDSIIKDKRNLYQEDHAYQFSLDFYKNLSLKIINDVCMENSKNLNLYKNKLNQNALSVLAFLNHQSGFVDNNGTIDNHLIIKDYLSLFLDKNGKINLQNYNEREKYEFITNVIFNPNKYFKEGYRYFYPSDLVDYINHNTTEYRAFFEDDAMEYISNHINKIKPEVLNNNIDFAERCEYEKELKMM